MFAVISFISTVLLYGGAKLLYRRTKYIFLSPLVICPIVLISLLLSSHVPYDTYNNGTRWITDMLQPATVAFAVPLYKYHKLLKKHALEIMIGVSGGSVIAILSSIFYGKWLHVAPAMIDSLAPRSVTTPFAMNVSQNIGGLPVMTAVFVILTGVTGMIVGPLILRWLPIKQKISQGMLLGMGAHGAGASKAYEIGPTEGVIASLTMIVAGLVTIVLAPVLVPIVMSV
jgi:predicted murein hydrolase (TIGR00659 family)